MNSISSILKNFINSRIPQKATNVFWQMFNGIEAMFTQLEYQLNIRKRENNMLTAVHALSLRDLAAKNGFEPTLNIPSSGFLMLKASPKLFNRVGYPLYIPPYSEFVNSITGAIYYYSSDKPAKLTSETLIIPVVEGEIKSITKTCTENYIESFYLQEDNISNNSISIKCGDDEYLEVKSFFDNENINENKQFIVKFSNDNQNPIIIYVRGCVKNDALTISYRTSSGELGNIDYKTNFSTEDIIDINGIEIDINEEDLSITNASGFQFGSNGTDINAYRAAIGYNHGQNLLYDSVSYRNFINKYSTLLFQQILLPDDSKAINNIYISKKQSINFNTDIEKQYVSIIENQLYYLSKEEISNLSKLISEYEFCLSSHNLFQSKSNHYAFQILFNTQNEVNFLTDKLKQLIYGEFSKFLNDRYHQINIETLFNTFMETNKCNFEYTIFNQNIENDKIQNRKFINTPYIINHGNNLTNLNVGDCYLPILKGDFNICDSSFKTIKLFFDINIVAKTNIQ